MVVLIRNLYSLYSLYSPKHSKPPMRVYIHAGFTLYASRVWSIKSSEYSEYKQLKRSNRSHYGAHTSKKSGEYAVSTVSTELEVAA